MTGFASKSFTFSYEDGTKLYFTMNLKSLNARYFELSSKIPFSIQYLETEFLKIFKQYLHRGHISLSIQMSNQACLYGSVEPSLSVAHHYLKAIQSLQQQCALPGTITIQDIISLPNMFVVEERVLDESFTNFILDAIEQVTKELIQARSQEGSQLQHDIMQRSTILGEIIDNIAQRSSIFLERRQKEIQDLLAGLDPAMPELTLIRRNQLYTELDRIDIHEEIIRFNSHLENLLKTIENNTHEKGRRLDFIVQELLREINTIAAKCCDAFVSGLAINAKVELEKIREQIQNIV